jgi:hypothetical protein
VEQEGMNRFWKDDDQGDEDAQGDDYDDQLDDE